MFYLVKANPTNYANMEEYRDRMKDTYMSK